MSNALDVITLEQLEKLKKLGLVVVHSKPTKNMLIDSCAKSSWKAIWDLMVASSVNQQAREVDWSKYEKPKVNVKYIDRNTKVIWEKAPKSPYVNWYEELTKYYSTPESPYLKELKNYIIQVLNNELRNRNIK